MGSLARPRAARSSARRVAAPAPEPPGTVSASGWAVQAPRAHLMSMGRAVARSSLGNPSTSFFSNATYALMLSAITWAAGPGVRAGCVCARMCVGTVRNGANTRGPAAGAANRSSTTPAWGCSRCSAGRRATPHCARSLWPGRRPLRLLPHRPASPAPRPHLLVHKQPRVVARGGRLELGPALHLVAGHPHQRVLAHQHLAGCGQRAAEVLQLLHGQALVPQAHHHRAALQQALQLLHSLLLALPADRCLYLQARQAGWPGRRRCRWEPQEWQRVQGQGLQGVGQGHASRAHSSARAQGRPGGRSSGGGRLPSGARRDAPEGCHDAAAWPAARAGRLPAVPLLPWRSCCWRRPGGTCVQFYVGIVKCASPEPSRACVVVPAPHAPALCPAHRAHAAWPPAGSSPDSTDCNPRIQAAWDGMPGPAYGLAAWVMHMRTLPQEGWQRLPPPLRCWLAEGSTWQNGEALGRASAPCSSGAPCVRGQRMGFGGLAAT